MLVRHLTMYRNDQHTRAEGLVRRRVESRASYLPDTAWGRALYPSLWPISGGRVSHSSQIPRPLV